MKAVGLLAAVLAGGGSVRFGSPKWEASVGGVTLGARALAALSGFPRVVAVGSAAAPSPQTLEVWPDTPPGLGPLGGIRSALLGAEREGWDGAFVLACDLPFVDATLVRHLVARWRGEQALVPLGPGGAEPLCSIWSVEALAPLEERLARGERSPQRLLRHLAVAWVPYVDACAVSPFPEPFLNVNTVAAQRRAEALLLATPGAGSRDGPASPPPAPGD